MARNGFSARVSLGLIVEGKRLELSHVGPTKVYVRDRCDPVASNSDAELVITVEDRTDTKKVCLPHGIPNAPQWVPYI
jgi:hypothetical protein